MRLRFINFLKAHPYFLDFFWKVVRWGLKFISLFIPIQKKTMLFASFGGRKFDDSPRAIYEEICRRQEFDDWKLIWAFVDPEQYEIPRGEKVKIDTPVFFKTLISSQVWVSNSGMDRDIDFRRKGITKIETWHGTPLKKIGGEENHNSMKVDQKKEGEKGIIRCAQSSFDREIFSRIFNVPSEDFLLSDLPRNDSLLHYSPRRCEEIRRNLGIGDRKVILYVPTYREYLINENRENYIAPPMDLSKWERQLFGEYVLLIRAHYAVSAALNIQENGFVKDVSSYPLLNDLYAIADIMISDYSSCYFDYAILDRPMMCFAYDRAEYEEKRGLYLDLQNTLPCPVDQNEDDVLAHIQSMDREKSAEKTKEFHHRFAPNAGHASACVVDALEKRLQA